MVGLIPTISHLSGLANFEGALAIGAIFLYYSARFALQRSAASARHLLLASILYLPMLFALLALDKNYNRKIAVFADLEDR